MTASTASIDWCNNHILCRSSTQLTAITFALRASLVTCADSPHHTLMLPHSQQQFLETAVIWTSRVNSRLLASRHILQSHLMVAKTRCVQAARPTEGEISMGEGKGKLWRSRWHV